MKATDVSPYLCRTLDTVGDGSGQKNANVNGSVTPQIFKISPPADGKIVLARMIIEIRGSGGFRAEGYGDIALGLSNGVEVGRVDDASGDLLVDYLDGIPITSNGGWARVCYDVDVKTWGAGDTFLTVRWTFSKSGTSPILIPDSPAFGVRIRDDVSTLLTHHFTVQGYR